MSAVLAIMDDLKFNGDRAERIFQTLESGEYLSRFTRSALILELSKSVSVSTKRLTDEIYAELSQLEGVHVRHRVNRMVE